MMEVETKMDILKVLSNIEIKICYEYIIIIVVVSSLCSRRKTIQYYNLH